MKSLVLHRKVALLSMAFGIVFLSLTSALEAQSSGAPSSLSAPAVGTDLGLPSGGYINVATAKGRLEGAMLSLKTTMGPMESHATGYSDLVYKFGYYEDIHKELLKTRETGSEGVENALTMATLKVMGDFNAGLISKQTYVTLTSDAIQLLKA